MMLWTVLTLAAITEEDSGDIFEGSHVGGGSGEGPGGDVPHPEVGGGHGEGQVMSPILEMTIMDGTTRRSQSCSPQLCQPPSGCQAERSSRT